MTFATTFISIHMAKVISARADQRLGSPVVISVKGTYSDTEISLHVENAEYAQRLATAINDAVNTKYPEEAAE